MLFPIMLVRPNETIVEGKVREVRPAADGFGCEVLVDVLRNVSPSPADDFIQPAGGDQLILFATEQPPADALNRTMRVSARLNAGHFGERKVLDHLEPLS